MENNIKKTDKIIRVVIAIVAAILGLYISPWYYVITVLALITVIVSHCWLYDLFKNNKNKKRKVKKKK